MKGKKCFGVLLVLFTIFGLSLSGYSNTNALIYSGLSLKPTGNTWTSVGGKIITTNPALTTTIDSNRHVRFSDTNLRLINLVRLEYPNNVTVSKDKYYIFTIGFQNYDVERPIIWNFESTDSNFKILSIQPQSDQQLYPYNDCSRWSMSNNIWTCTNWGSANNRVTVYFDIVLKPNSDGTFKPQIINSDSFFKFYYGIGVDTLVYVSDLWEYEETGTGADKQYEQEQQDRNDIEQQSSSTEQSADTASDDVGGATTNILGAINGFATAVTNIQAGTCILPEISAYGMNLGRLNLCTYSPPAWVQGLTSTILSLITLKMAISIFYRIMGLLDGVLGGKK